MGVTSSRPQLSTDQPHGTMRRYRSGCHCPECREANTADWNNWARRTGRVRSHHMVPVDVRVLGRQIELAGLSLADADALIARPGYLAKVLERGRIDLYRLDRLAVALGAHYSQFIPTERIAS